MTTPTKGTVWLHASRTDFFGEPLELTVTWIGRGKVYSHDETYHTVITPVGLFDTLCRKIIHTPRTMKKAEKT